MSGLLIERIRATAVANPAAPAFIYQDGILDYGQFVTLIHATSSLFYERGIRPGDTVGLSMGRWPMHCVAFLALARLGALSVPLPPKLKEDARRELIVRFGINTLVTNWRPVAELPLARVILLDSMSLSGNIHEPDLGGYYPDDTTPMRIALTSGTTGARRGVMHTHASFTRRVERTLYECDKDTRLLPPDLHITASILLTMGVLMQGGTVVFDKTFSTTDIVNTIRLYGVTHCLLSPAAVPPVAAVLPGRGLALPSLRHLRLVGATPTPAMTELLRTRFTPHVFTLYGITEIGILAFATPEILCTAPGSTGRITPWAQVEVLDADGQQLPPGKSGEIRVRGEGMPDGYYREPAASNAPARFQDGWFYPGDVGHVTADGLVFIEGRSDDIVNLGGHKYALPLIDSGIESHPEVRTAVAFTIENTDGSVMVGAGIERRPAATPTSLAGIATWSRKTLNLPVAMRLFDVTSLTRDDMGKIDRNALRTQVLEDAT